MLRSIPAEPRRILVVRLGSLGDVARVLPMLAGLRARFPSAEIDWVVQKRAVDLLAGHPQLDRVFVVPFRRWRDVVSIEAWRLARGMRAREYDLILDFQGSMKGTVAALLASRRSVRVGWSPLHAEEGTFLLFHGHRTPPGRRVNRHLRFRCLVDWLDVPDVPGEPPTYGDDDVRPVDGFVARSPDLPRPWILIYPWTSTAGSHRRWDLDRMRRATRELAERTGGTALVGWGPAEEAAARAFADSVEGSVLAPRTTIRGLCYLLERCDLYVGVNTGPMHLAALVGAPVVAVFGARSDPGIHAPIGWRGAVEVIATPEARELRAWERRGLEPFDWPDPGTVVEAAHRLLAEAAARDDLP
ncbi:MAG: glycosyltransferase family 9 protein [Gemmatimonadetes bacterium]|nr:glycosyltransferase family 9 protein [Gemmatimonadota bacterium]